MLGMHSYRVGDGHADGSCYVYGDAHGVGDGHADGSCYAQFDTGAAAYRYCNSPTDADNSPAYADGNSLRVLRFTHADVSV